MARAVQVFKNNALEHNRLSAEREKAEKMAIRDKRAAQLKIADDFESRVKGVVDAVGSASSEMRATAQSMSATAEETNMQASAVASASEQATTNVQMVASAAEEMSASIGEIGI
ncbi:MAG: methyl-accepting chemotaxis protein, partial [Alphaproteobacteria bacterium]